MKSNSRWLLVVAALLATSVSSAAWAADEPVKASAAGKDVYVHRSTQFVGMKVFNSKGENLGTIKDVMIEFPSGECRYAAISFGGTLGFGSKLFAVPFKVLHLKYDSNDKTWFVEFDVNRERLEKAPGFAEDKWPDGADRAWSQEVDRYYTTPSVSAKPGATEKE